MDASAIACSLSDMHIPESITERDDYRRCAEFHGHTCMGLTIGYLAAKAALELLEEARSVDEELICIAETDACGCDAIQVLTGCTFGKGNFIYRNIGKMAFTFASRSSGKGFRLVLKSELRDIPDEERDLREKIRDSQATAEQIKQYETLYQQRSAHWFARPPADFFTITKVTAPLPPTARIAPSEYCTSCGEEVMVTKLTTREEEKLCQDCLHSTPVSE
ncbi:MAG: formylmethanofuran dehydrogenase [Desulfobulbaceae bacterium]|nr:MAG: formylmethanofuran dehydrogenase [Desulfobulbaceae bacterium]